MKILIVTAEFGLNGGGLSLSCHKLYELLSSHNEVNVLNSTIRPIETTVGSKLQGVDNAISMEFKLKTDSQLYQSTSIVIGFGGKFNGYYASLLARKLKARFILSLRGSDVNLAKWTCEDSWFLQEAVSTADTIVCLSKEMRDNVLLQNPQADSKIILIPNILSKIFSEYIKFANIPSSVVIGCAATHLNEKKGVTNLLSMIYEFKKISAIPITLELIGHIDDDLRKGYDNHITKLDIKDNVRFYDKQTRSELAKKMKDWDFYIQASVCEGHPNSIIEALQNGIPFISSRTGFLAESLYDEMPELFFNDFRPSRMALKLKSLIELPDKELLYNKTFNILKSKCNNEKIFNLWQKVLRKSHPQNELDIEQIISVGLHDVEGVEHDSITTPVDVFRRFVKKIHETGCGLCSMRQYLGMDLEERKRWIVCTFDDGYEGLKTNALPILNEYGYTSTVFICTDLIGKENRWNNKDGVLRRHLNLDDLNELYEQGWEIASHGVNHYNLLKLSDAEILYELESSKRFVEDIWRYAETYAYPYGAFNEFIKSCVGKYYQYAFAVSKGGTSLVTDKLQIRRYSITEIYKMLSIIP